MPVAFTCPTRRPASAVPLGYESSERRAAGSSADPKSPHMLRRWGNPNGHASRAVPTRVGASREQAVSICLNSTYVVLLVGGGLPLLPVLAAHAVALPVQIERVGWEHADRTLNVLGSVA